MVAASKTKVIELNISNFGPITKAGLELRPMSVFVGPSNTGKSYLGVLIYALHQFFSTYAASFSGGTIRPIGLPFIKLIDEMALSDADVDNVYAWAATERMRIESANRSGTSPPDSDLSPEVSDLIRRALGEVSSLSEALKEEMMRCFGFETSESLVRYSPNDINRIYDAHCCLK